MSVIASLLLLTGCGGGGGSTTAASTTPAVGVLVSGSVVKGPVHHAKVDVYTFAADGTQGTLITGGVLTDAYGAWSARLPLGVTGPFMVVATGGSYVDEYTGVTMSQGAATLRGIMDANATTAALTPISDAAVATIQKMIVDGYASSVTVALPQVRTNYTKSFGFDPLSVTPPAPQLLTNPKTTAAQKQYAAILGGISKLANDVYTQLTAAGNAPTRAAIDAQMVADFAADGLFDGYGANAQPLTVNVGGTLKALNTVFTGGNNLANAVASYQASPKAPLALANTAPILTTTNFQQTLFTPPVTGGGTTTPPAATPVLTVTGMTPTSGAIGTAVTINGSGFTSFMAVSIVFNGVTTPVASSSLMANKIVVSVPVGATTGGITLQGLPGGSAVTTAVFTVNTQTPPATTVDTIPPVVTAPANITVTTLPGVSTAPSGSGPVASLLFSATATDNVAVVGVISNNAPANLPLGVTTVTFTATDAAGNSGTASTNITVKQGVAGPSYNLAVSNPQPTVQNLSKITYNGTTFVAVGDSTILSSMDGKNWLERYTLAISTYDRVIGVTWGNGMFIVMTSRGLTYTSTDGITWVQGTQAAASSGLTFGNGKFVTVGQNVQTSPDGVTWTNQVSSTPKFLSAVAWTGTQFVAVASATRVDPYGAIITSLDAITWTASTQAISNVSFSSIAGNGNTIVAVGTSSIDLRSSAVWTSIDGGATWTDVSKSGLGLSVFDVTWAGTQFVAVGNSDSTTATPGSIWGENIMTSVNGITWVKRNSLPAGFVVGLGKNLSGISSNAMGTLMVAVGQYGTILTSSDGITWNNQKKDIYPKGGSFQSVLWSNTQYVAVGDPSTSGSPAMTATSADGYTWVAQTSPLIKGGLKGLASNGTVLVAVGFDSYATGAQTGAIITSTDNGVTWTQQTSNIAAKPINDVFWSSAHAMFVAVSQNGNITTSPDGVTWATQTLPVAGSQLFGVYGNATSLVAVGSQPLTPGVFTFPPAIVLVSTDGVTWTEATNPATQTMQDIVWDGTQFVAAGGNGQMIQSADGVTWAFGGSAPTTVSGAFYFNKLVWTGTSYIAVGLHSEVFTSTDLFNWTMIQTPGFQLFDATVHPTTGQVVIVGNSLGGSLILTGQ